MEYALPAFLPDRLPGADALTVCKNAFPATNGYRSVGAFQAISDALPDTFLGGASFKASDGTASLLAGTASTLSRLASGSWSSLLSGLTVGNRWRFVQFGDNAVAVNGSVTYAVDLVAATAAAIGGAPSFTDICVVGDYVVGAQPNGDKLKVRNSAFNDHTGWTVGTNQCTEQTMLAGGEVMGVVGGEYGVILQRHQLTRMSRTGEATAPFEYDPFGQNFGCASKASIVAVHDTIFYLADRGFAVCAAGQEPRPIGYEKFDQSFRDMLGEDDFERIWSAVDPKNTRVYWGIPGVTGTVWGYDWALERPFTLELAFEGLFAGFENSLSLEDVAAIYTNIDTMTLSLDDPRFSGGAPRFYVVQNGAVGTLSGANLIAEFESGEFALSGQLHSRVRAFWPETDAIAGVTVSMHFSPRKGDAGATVTGSNMQSSGRIPLRASGKYLRLGITIDDPDWSYINGGVFEMSAGGIRG